jgi:vacuolar-type H+-ATPase catalytic subunit A/Vma1
MKRCVNNNFSFEGFWRQWHATLNKWIIRYMCSSPTGSRSRTALFPITKGLTSCFPGTFHWAGSARSFGACGSYSRLSGCGMTCGALSRPQPSAAPQLTRVMPVSPKLLCRWRWLAWAWINCVCFSIEIMCKKLFKARAEQGRERGGWASALRGSRYYRVTVALAASFNILCLITVSAACASPYLCLRELLSRCFFA